MSYTNTNIKLFYIYTLLSHCIFDRGIFILFLLDKGFNNIQIGILQTALFWTSVISEVPTGIFSDTWGRKYSIIIGLLLLAGSAGGHIAFNNFSSFIILFIVQGLAFAFISGSDSALLYDSLKVLGRETEYIKIYSQLSAIGSITLGLVMTAGGFLGKLSWQGVYLPIVVAMLLGAVTVAFMQEVHIEEDCILKSDESEADEYLQKEKIANIFFDFAFKSHRGRELLILIVAFAIFHSAITPYFIFAQKLFVSYGLSSDYIGIIFGFVEISSGLVSLLADRAAFWMPLSKMIPLIMLVVSLLMVSNAINSLILAIAVFFIIMVFPEIMYILVDNFFHMRLPSKIRATALSFISFNQSLLIGLSYFLYGFILDRLSPGTAIAITAIIPLLASLLVIKFFMSFQDE